MQSRPVTNALTRPRSHMWITGRNPMSSQQVIHAYTRPRSHMQVHVPDYCRISLVHFKFLLHINVLGACHTCSRLFPIACGHCRPDHTCMHQTYIHIHPPSFCPICTNKGPVRRAHCRPHISAVSVTHGHAPVTPGPGHILTQ